MGDSVCDYTLYTSLSRRPTDGGRTKLCPLSITRLDKDDKTMNCLFDAVHLIEIKH